MDDTQKLSVIESLLRTEHELIDTREHFYSRMHGSVRNKRWALRIQIAEIETHLARTRSLVVAYLAGPTAFEAPSAADFEEVKRLVNALDRMIAADRTVAAIMKVVAELMGILPKPK